MSAVLVMNKSWAPVEIWSLFKTIKNVYLGKAQIVDRESNLYNWDEWVETWSDAEKIAKASFTPIGGSQVKIAAPEVVRLTEYNGFIFKNVKLCRRNVYIRDGGKCQYCGEKKGYNELNVDHVIPQGQGGKTKWNNIVLSCIPCNQDKGCRTPDEAGLTLIRKPFTPRWYHMDRDLSKTLKNWESLFGEIYWDIELEED